MKNRCIVLLIITGILLLIFGCQIDSEQTIGNPALRESSAADTKIISDTGVIRYINLEGGFYGIVGEKGNYDPINLPGIFKQDGLRVKFTAEVVEDMGSIHMWGTLIKIISMQTIGNVKPLVMDIGTVRRSSIQGRPWIIVATTGTYQPILLPNGYAVENLKVNFVGIIRNDIIIIPGIWPALEILEIKRVDPIIVKLGQEFKLPVKESALVPGDEVLLTFKTVLQDSRCPIGVECFWQGEAIILVNVKIGSVDYGDFRMSTYDNPSIIKAGKYSVQFTNLVPYPVYGQTIDPNSYVGSFIIR